MTEHASDCRQFDEFGKRWCTCALVEREEIERLKAELAEIKAEFSRFEKSEFAWSERQAMKIMALEKELASAKMRVGELEQALARADEDLEKYDPDR